MDNYQDNSINIFANLKANLGKIFMVGLIVASLVFIGTTFVTPEYKASNELLIIQQDNSGADAYSMAKSAEYLSEILSRAVYSSTFYTSIIEKNPSVSLIDYGKDNEEIEKNWSKSIEASSGGMSGIISLNVYHPKKETAKSLAETIYKELLENGKNYHGKGDQIQIKLLNGPVLSKGPARPAILMNTLLGFLIGSVIYGGLLFISTKENLVINDNQLREMVSERINETYNESTQLTTSERLS